MPSFEFLTTENDKLDKITEEIPITVKLPQAGQETATTEISSLFQLPQVMLPL